MSFDYNPFRHIEIVEPEPGRFAVLCSSCGGEKPLPSGNTSIAGAFYIMGQHVETSHERTTDDFAGWSVY